MKKVRLGMIGCGGIAGVHAAYLPDMSQVDFVAASDVVSASVQAMVDRCKVQGFDDAGKMMKSGLIDAVLITTPHYFHPTFSMAAMKAGLHVLTEKPVAVTAKAAEQVNKFHKKYPKLVYSAMFQMRTAPVWKKVKELIDSGALGKIVRFNWIVTDWFRSQRYYDSGTWRATWKGEGGGVLLNQCPHNLDLICWLLGTPSSVYANVALGKYHKIEVEDDVTALLEWKNGATGVFVTTTGQAPGTNRLEICGDHGRVVVDKGRIEFCKTVMPVSQYCKTTENAFGEPAHDKITYELANNQVQHRAITENFADAVLGKAKLIAPAEEGLHGLELGNAMLMSGLTGKKVDIPTNRNAYDKLLSGLIAKSKVKKGPAKKAKVNMAASYQK